MAQTETELETERDSSFWYCPIERPQIGTTVVYRYLLDSKHDCNRSSRTGATQGSGLKGENPLEADDPLGGWMAIGAGKITLISLRITPSRQG